MYCMCDTKYFEISLYWIILEKFETELEMYIECTWYLIFKWKNLNGWLFVYFCIFKFQINA